MTKTTTLEGELTVISAQADWQVLHTAEFGEPVFATPAIGLIYLRTAGASVLIWEEVRRGGIQNGPKKFDRWALGCVGVLD